MIDLSSAEARRLALGALGFGVKRPARAGITHVRATAARLGAIQVDSVNVLARAHYLPTFSRYGAYPMSALDDLVHGKRELFEYWGHAACFLPVDLYPLMRWRMEGQLDAWAGLDVKRKNYIEAVYREIAERGPLSAGEISIGGKSTGPWWGWSDGKAGDRIPVPTGSRRDRGTPELRAVVRSSRARAARSRSLRRARGRRA